MILARLSTVTLTKFRIEFSLVNLIMCWRCDSGRIYFTSLNDNHRQSSVIFKPCEICSKLFLDRHDFWLILFIIFRITLTCLCAMDFRKFPMDRQVCELNFLSCTFRKKIYVLMKYKRWCQVTAYVLVFIPAKKKSKYAVFSLSWQLFILPLCLDFILYSKQ